MGRLLSLLLAVVALLAIGVPAAATGIPSDSHGGIPNAHSQGPPPNFNGIWTGFYGSVSFRITSGTSTSITGQINLGPHCPGVSASLTGTIVDGRGEITIVEKPLIGQCILEFLGENTVTDVKVSGGVATSFLMSQKGRRGKYVGLEATMTNGQQPAPEALSVVINAPNDPLAVGAEVNVAVTVTAVGGVADAITLGPGLVSTDAAVVTKQASGIDGFYLLEGASKTFVFTLSGAKAGTAALSVSATGTMTIGSVQASAQAQLTITGNQIVALAGERGTTPNSVSVTMTLTNTGKSDISGLSFTDPTGLENDGVALKNGNIGPTKSGLTLTSGPTPSLPTTLPAGGPPVVIHYTYSADTSGDAVLVANATGSDDTGKTVNTKAALTVYVSNPPESEADYQKLVTSALLAADSITAQGQNSIANAAANGLASALNLPPASPAQQAAAVQLGLPPQLGVLVGTKSDSELVQWFNNFSATLATDFKSGLSSLGETGKALAIQWYQYQSDPQYRDEVSGRLMDALQALPAKTQGALESQLPNMGYAVEALVASNTFEGQKSALSDDAAAAASMLASLKTNLGYAVSGFTDAMVADAANYKKDPSAYVNASSTRYAQAFEGLLKDEVTALIGEGIGPAISAASKAAGFSALAADATTIDSSVAAAVKSTAPAAADSTAALIEEASLPISPFQTLPAGTVLDATQAAQLGGMVPGDQVGFQKALQYIKDTYGVDLEVGVRTSEPLSVGIDGSPKLSFMKPKAVSSIDMLIGGPSQIDAYTAAGEPFNSQVFQGGVTTVFKPVSSISEEALAALKETNPDFVAQYTDRLASQTKLWNEYQDSNSTLRVLVKGSSESESGVTAIANVPGFPVPPPPPGAQPLTYLQQLDQPAFVEQYGLTSDQAQTLKAQLSNSPGAVQVDYIARTNPDGSISFFDGLNNNRPFVSDLDLQYVRPANGAPWPPGKQAMIQQQFEAQLEKNTSRLPDHGASGTAADLTAGSIEVADGFVVKTSDPAFAQAVADNLAIKYASNTAIFSSNAARLEAQAFLATDPAVAKALRNQATIYRQIAAKFAKIDAAYLLKKYPPGEKIIVIKLGDVRVGYGPSPKT